MTDINAEAGQATALAEETTAATTEAPVEATANVEATTETTTTAVEQEVAKVEDAVSNSLQDLLSDEYREKSNLKDFKDVNDLAKSYLSLQHLVGKSIRIPGEDASPEAKQEFLDKIKDVDGVLIKNDEQLFDKLGRPETSEGYAFDDVVDQELVAIDPTITDEIESFKKVAHELGLTNDQAKALVDMQLKQLQGHTSEFAQARESGLEALQKVWGADFDNRLNAAKQVAKIYAEKHGDSMSELINGPSGNNPAFIQMLSELAGMYKEKGHEGMQSATFGVSPEMALAKISEKRGDTGFMEAYMSPTHPNHKNAVNELQKLYQIANGAR